jgi:hypothetical protein
LSDRLLADFQREYGTVLPPALIADELITDFLGAKLRFDPLPTDRFAQTQLVNGDIVVTVNTLTEDIDGVKDSAGVMNVAKWHEIIHVVDDADELTGSGGTLLLPGFDEPAPVICLRGGPQSSRPGGFQAREFWAEEAGRAAAVSLPALRRTDAFQSFLSLANRNAGNATAGWSALYGSAEAIGVNISALVKQLRLEGLLVLREGSRELFVPTRLFDVEGAG